MKQFIVLCAVLPLLIVIMLQSCLDQVAAYKISAVNQVVYSASEEAKQAGGFTDDIEKNLTNSLKHIGFLEEEIILDLDKEMHSRGELIHYLVKVRIKNAMVKTMLENNSYYYSIDSFTSSEALY